MGLIESPDSPQSYPSRAARQVTMPAACRCVLMCFALVAGMAGCGSAGNVHLVAVLHPVSSATQSGPSSGGTADAIEGAMAFGEKRSPVFIGR